VKASRFYTKQTSAINPNVIKSAINPNVITFGFCVTVPTVDGKALLVVIVFVVVVCRPGRHDGWKLRRSLFPGKFLRQLRQHWRFARHDVIIVVIMPELLFTSKL